MFPFQHEYEIMISALKDAKAKIEYIDNTQIAPLKNKVLADINRHLNFLSLQVGQPTTAEITAPENQHPPLTRMFGKPIIVKEKKQPQDLYTPDGSANDYRAFRELGQTTAKDIEAAENRAKVEDLYPQFTSIDTAQIVDSYSDLEIRTVAKWAGLPVTETNPKNTDAKFVEQIKKAIKKKLELEKAGEVKPTE